MSTFTAPFRRVDTAKGHHYVDASNRRIPGVTTIVGEGLPKPALINWAGNATADYALDHWDELADLATSARLTKLKGGRYETRDAASNRGTEVHRIAEQLITGAEIEIPDDIAGHAESYVRFLDEWEPQPVLIEASICSYKHGYAGTLDLIADFPTRGTRALLDVKTSRSGIFGETALQLAAYRYADVILGERPVPDVDEVLGLHITADDYQLIPIVADENQFRDFRYVQQVARFVHDSRDLVGMPLVPTTRRQRRRLESTAVAEAVT